MEYINLNLAPITLAAAVGLLVGLVHFLVSRPGDRPGLDFLLLSAIAEFWIACILAGALIIAPPLALPWVMTIATPVLIWLGFLVPALMVNLRFRGMPGHMAAADALHWLFVLLAQALVMQAIGLTRPPGM
ncbi:hypothetical protein [Sandaracinobacter sp.]|uniref:hypothetical protein n=1 Tax=Sandaracinobacter sp. TaxID=2487581 RepID=UPI0035B37AF9